MAPEPDEKERGQQTTGPAKGDFIAPPEVADTDERARAPSMPDLDVSPKPAQTIGVQTPAPQHSIIGFMRECAAILVWVLIVCQVFLYDLEGASIRYLLPDESWPFGSKFFVSTVVICAILLGMRYKVFRRALTFVLFYPLRFMLFRILPRLIKYWAFTSLTIPAFVSFVRSFRTRTTVGLMGIVGSIMILRGQRSPAVASGMLLTGLLLLSNYVRHVKVAFSSTGPLSGADRIGSRIWRYSKATIIETKLKELKQLSADSADYSAKRTDVVQNFLLFRGLVLLTISGISRFSKNRRIELYLIISLLYTIVLTIFIFGLEYYGLGKIQVHAFAGTETGRFTDCLFFSLITFVHLGFGNVEPMSGGAKALIAAETMCGVLVFVILFFIITALIRSRYHENVTEFIAQLRDESRVLEAELQNNLGLTLEAAESELAVSSPGLSKLLSYMTAEETTARRDQAVGPTALI